MMGTVTPTRQRWNGGAGIHEEVRPLFSGFRALPEVRMETEGVPEVQWARNFDGAFNNVGSAALPSVPRRWLPEGG